MFKIVETVEKGSKKLTIVPSGWEINGELAWPKFRADKLIKVAKSLPEDSWFRMSCKLKRNYLINYDVAEEELSSMLDKDETEQEDSAPIEGIRKRPKVLKQTVQYCEDFNNFAQNCSVLEATSEQPSQNQKIKILSHKVIDVNDFTQSDDNLLDGTGGNNGGEVLILQSDIQEELGQSNLFVSSEDLNNKFDTILVNQERIIQNQNSILKLIETTATKDNQLLIIQQLAKYEVTLDMMAKKLSKTSHTNESPENEKLESNNMAIEEIKTLDDLEKLENLLQDKQMMKNFVNRLSVVCGQKGSGNGLNNCYLLVDRIFSRQFMTLCSWAGGGRDKKEKIPFKIYKNVINLFFKVIYLSDTTFTLKDCEEFFKNVIRNSTRRNQSNMLRNSAVKRRPKDLSYTKEKRVKTDVDEAKDEENLIEPIEDEGQADNEEEKVGDDGNEADVEEKL